MKDHIGWGRTFQAFEKEFVTGEIEELREHCRKLIADACTLGLAGYRAGAISFEKFDYEFLLQRTSPRWWVLEVADFPPEGRGRMSAARRAREKRERQERRAQHLAPAAARPKQQPRITDARKEKTKKTEGDKRELPLALLRMRAQSEFEHKLLTASVAMDAIGHNVRAQYRHATTRLRELRDVMRTAFANVLYRTHRYVEKLTLLSPLEKRIEATSKYASGMRLESRPYKIGRLQIHLNTWTPIDPGFDQIWDTSLFGVRLLEGENL